MSDVAVLLIALVALAVGFGLGRFTAGRRGGPSDVSRLGRQVRRGGRGRVRRPV